ncbi:MAG: LysM peptidoglycan-binding domain-containing protein [Chloroflexi bacterium]|nr:MAG: LysM peptidoglycan-binding domain-containing protein [Chloroflexota bacterium]
MADDIDKRVNYFDRQFLQAEDFIDEQSYHIERHRLHNRLMHTPGIAEGLVVERENDALLVQPGVAIDGQGREIILTEPRVASNLQQYAGQFILIVIAYDEQPDDDYAVEVNNQTQYSRIRERPELTIVPADTAPARDQVVLARVRIDDNGIPVDIDLSVRSRAGIRSTGEATLADTVEGDFFVKGNLQVGGNIDYGGTLRLPELDSGAASDMWFADDVTSPVAITANDTWQVVDGMVVEFEIHKTAKIVCNYGINIQPGERAAPPDELYTIRAGDTLSSIALKYYGSASEASTIQAYNNLSYEDTRSLRVGSQIRIPAAGAPVLSGRRVLYVMPTADSVNLRSAPTTNSTVIGTVKRGEDLEVIEDYESAIGKVGQRDQWLQVRTASGQDGYAAAWLFQVSRDAEVTGQVAAPVLSASVTQDFVATRLAVNDTAYPASGSFFQPSSEIPPHNITLNGTLALLLGAGIYRVVLQWYKFGDGLMSWRCDSASLGGAAAKGFLAGRSLVVMAFYGSGA